MSIQYSVIKTIGILAMSSLFVFCINGNNKKTVPKQSKISSIENDRDRLLDESEEKVLAKAKEIKKYLTTGEYNEEVCFLVDMNLPSGLKRFYVYDLTNDEILNTGLMAHGSCNENYLKDAKFSNKPSCGCSSLGKYSIGGKYVGKYGTAYKLFGLDSSNSNAFKRNIVLHSFSSVPDEETYPRPICNSLGCPMVSKQFFNYLIEGIDNSSKPILLWIFK